MILAYLRERFRLAFFGPIACVLALGALGRFAEPLVLVTTAAAGLLLLAEFRIWDDVADRRKDAVEHPDRVLVRAENHQRVVELGIALLPLNLAIAALRDPSFVSVALLAFLHAALGTYYLLRRGRTVLGDQVLLAKYPAFVCILAGDRVFTSPLPVAVAAALIYVAASVYEAWHDPVSPLAQLLGGRS